MNDLFVKLYVKSQELLSREEGQDLVEYALIAALISVALAATLPKLATAIEGTFTSVISDL
jgi:Flp pilus assembly pilin Flp